MKRAMACALAATAIWGGDLPVGGLRQHIEFGYLGSTGNSESKTLHGVYANEYRWTPLLETTFRSDAYYGEKEGTRTDERYRGHLLGTRYFSESRRWYAYAEVGALRNVFEGYEQQYNGGVGMGYVFKETDRHLFKARGGYQYRRSNLTDGGEEDLHYAKVGLNHTYRFSKRGELKSELNFLDDLSRGADYETVLRVGLKSALVERLSLKIGLEVKYDNMPPLDDNGEALKKTDTKTTVGIVYDF